MRKMRWNRFHKAVLVVFAIGLAIAVMTMVIALINLTDANTSSKAFREYLDESNVIESIP
ncbi:MAG: hypothetical protein JW697_01770 [Kosmotogaceae bacterium]|nr:hypothetical protein [Kosmotogaceae bacterium]